MSAEMRNDSSASQCPVKQQYWGHRKTARPQEPATSPVECDERGIWHIHGFKEARIVLRSQGTRQAGLGGDLFKKGFVRSLVYMEGKQHQQYRKQTARFFTPKAVSSNYERLIEQQVDQLIATLKREKQVDFGHLSSFLGSSVVLKIVGLTQSRFPGIQGRVDTFIERLPGMEPQYGPFDKSQANRFRWNLFQIIEVQWRMLMFFLLDVQPAIQAHKRQPEEDLISHLLTQKYSNIEILAECISFTVAGLETSREFMSVALWHFLEQPELRARYLVASDEERDGMLQEILRLETIVERLYRRATEDIPLYIEGSNTHVTIPAGALIDISLYEANTDESVVGERPLEICPARELKEARVSNAVMSFGDGHHRCPGSFVALREADIFLRRLLALEGLHIIKQPELCWNDLLTTYMLRDFIVGIA